MSKRFSRKIRRLSDSIFGVASLSLLVEFVPSTNLPVTQQSEVTQQTQGNWTLKTSLELEWPRIVLSDGHIKVVIRKPIPTSSSPVLPIDGTVESHATVVPNATYNAQFNISCQGVR